MSGPRDVVLCPGPPLLVEGLSGAQDVAAEVRAACLLALAPVLAAGPAEVVVVGGADESGAWPAGTPVDVRRFGTTGPRTPSGLPQSLGVGRWLLDRAGWRGPVHLQALAWEVPDAELDDLAARWRRRPDTAVLLIGEGSTRRGEQAPGFLDERAFPFDDTVADALQAGDADALHTLDDDLARELAVSARPVLRLLGRLATGPVHAELDYRDDPFGVSYFVASWQLAT